MTEYLSAYYLPLDDDSLQSTAATESPWDTRQQHGGPPTALLARAVERAVDDVDLQVARFTADFLGPIPQGRVRTEVEVVRPGQRITMLRARLLVDERPAVAATAWCIRRTPDSTADLETRTAAPPLPAEQPRGAFFPGLSPEWGYGRSIDWRFVSGDSVEPGPVVVWTRLRVPLVLGEPTTGVQRLLVVADSTNGVSGEVPMAQWLFIPPTMTATVQRAPEGDWMLLDASSTTGPDGIGLATGRMSDDRGPLAVVTQPLLVAPR